MDLTQLRVKSPKKENLKKVKRDFELQYSERYFML